MRYNHEKAGRLLLEELMGNDEALCNNTGLLAQCSLRCPLFRVFRRHCFFEVPFEPEQYLFVGMLYHEYWGEE
jgi:hypothetical protein